MAITSVRELQQTLTASMAQRSPAVQDLVYNSTPLAAVLRERGRIKTASGPEIRIPLMIDKLSAQWFTGYDKLRVDPKELINSAVFTWKRVVSMFSLTGTELMFNEGRGQILDLMSTYLEAAEMSAAEEFETALHGDGTGTGGRSIIGMGGAVPIITNAGTYGGIDRVTQAIWRTTTYNATSDFPTIGPAWSGLRGCGGCLVWSDGRGNDGKVHGPRSFGMEWWCAERAVPLVGRASVSTVLTESRVAPRSRTLARRPCSAAWSVTGPRRVVVPSSSWLRVRPNQVDQLHDRDRQHGAEHDDHGEHRGHTAQ